MDVLINVAIIILYQAIILAVIPISLKLFSSLDKELIRKLQHIGYTSSIFFLIHLFDQWYMALIPGAVLILLGFPFLYGLENTKIYNKILVDRKKNGGEMKVSLLFSQLSFTIMIVIFWGILGETFKFVIPVAILSWGIGDAMAAVIGKRYGKHKNVLPGADKNKTILGSSVMFLSVLLSVFFMLLVYTDFYFLYKVILAFFVAPFATLIELYSKKGFDTITLPLGVAFFLMIGIYLFEITVGAIL